MIYAPYDWVAHDWSIQNFCDDPACSVAALPVMFNDPHMFCYRAELANLDLSRYDLVILSDIEFESLANIQAWIQRTGIKKYVLAMGGLQARETLDTTSTVYRPWWCYNLLKYNTLQDCDSLLKPYKFDALLGARRPHRDYVMLAFQHYRLLTSNIVTYRDVFYTGALINHQTQEFANTFPDQHLIYPYVSPNLPADWEVTANINKSVSPYVPWKIYQNTWYSIVCETLGTGDCFFLSEKTAKAMYAGRVFVMFGNANFLKRLRQLGFETFGSVIDESYDACVLDFERFRLAFEQVRFLDQQDPVKVYEKLRPVLRHNRQHLFELQLQTQQAQRDLLGQHLMLGNIVN